MKCMRNLQNAIVLSISFNLLLEDTSSMSPILFCRYDNRHTLIQRPRNICHVCTSQIAYVCVNGIFRLYKSQNLSPN